MCEMLACGYVTKDKRNASGGYTYASDEAVSRSLRDKMRELGLHVASSEVVSFESKQVQYARAVMNLVTVHVRFTFSDGENTYGPYEAIGSGMDAGDKAAMKAMTSARKYAIAQSVLLSWGDDPEADASTDKIVNEPVPQPKELSSAAKKVLETGQKTAEQGIEALKAVWKMASAEAKKELSGHPDWDAVKAKAEKVVADEK